MVIHVKSVMVIWLDFLVHKKTICFNCKKCALGAFFVCEMSGCVYMSGILLAMDMFWWVLAVAFGYGIVIGSFLNVYIYRLHTGRSLAGRSHCMSCGTTLRWYDLLPIVSYIWLRGRCRYCSAYITTRYALVELLTGLLFVGVVLVESSWFMALIYCLIMSVLVIILVYDYYHLIIPNRLVLVLLALATLVLAQMWWVEGDVARILINVVSAVAGGAFFAFLWVVSKGRWVGLGDAKLAVPLGLLVGAEAVFSLVVLAFWVGALISLTYLAFLYLRRRGQTHLRFLPQQLTMKSEVPFAPFLILSFWIIFFFSFDALSVSEWIIHL